MCLGSTVEVLGFSFEKLGFSSQALGFMSGVLNCFGVLGFTGGRCKSLHLQRVPANLSSHRWFCDALSLYTCSKSLQTSVDIADSV